MSERSAEPTFTVLGPEAIIVRLAEIERRYAAIKRDFEANQREYELLRQQETVLIAEERHLLRRLPLAPAPGGAVGDGTPR